MRLEEFLLARLWDDECYARNASERAGEVWEEIWSGTVETADDLIATNDSQVSRFMVRFDPARIIAEVKAKRELILSIKSFEDQIDGEWGMCQGTADQDSDLRLLAIPYRDHPDFKPGWSFST